MSAVGIIPARHAATRFPGKPLAPIAGIPMIQRVWQGASEAKCLTRVIVATDDARIAEVCRSFGADVTMTSSEHSTGTDRVAEAAIHLDHEIVVNIQGDEPLIRGFVIDAVVEALGSDPRVRMSTLVHPAAAEKVGDPNRVKVVVDRAGDALYFSRSPIPALRDPDRPPPSLHYWQHVGLYAYRRDFLQEFVALEPTPAEQAEGLEQLRALENGVRIRVAVIEGWESLPVDVPADIPAVEARIRSKERADAR